MNGYLQNLSSLNGNINLNCDNLTSDTINFNYLDNNPSSYFDNINSNIQNQITILQNKNPDLSYSGSQSGFTDGILCNTSNNQTNYKILDIYDDGTNSVSIGCQYSIWCSACQIHNMEDFNFI